MPATTTLNERLAQAQREAEDLRTKLSNAEHDLNEALEDRDYAAAEKLKQAADALRQPVLIAEAHVKALAEGVQELERHRAEEQRATQERQRREQAAAMYEQARQAEAEAMDDMNRNLAEIPAAYAALRQAMEAAVVAEQRVSQARRDMHGTGVTAGYIDPTTPAPGAFRNASTKFEYSPLLTLVWRTPQLP